MQSSQSRHIVFLQALVLLGVILFGFFLAFDQGFISLTLESDRSYLSYVILTVYFLATVHWLVVCYRLSTEVSSLELLITIFALSLILCQNLRLSVISLKQQN